MLSERVGGSDPGEWGKPAAERDAQSPRESRAATRDASEGEKIRRGWAESCAIRGGKTSSSDANESGRTIQ